MQTNIDYRIYSIKCRAESEEWGVSSKIIRKESHFNEDMIVAVVIAINQLQINPKKIRNLNGIRTYGLCFSSAVLYQLSYEDLIGSRPISWVNLNRGKKNETEDPSGQLRFYLSRQARLRTPFCFVIYMNDISKLLDQWYKNWDFEIIK